MADENDRLMLVLSELTNEIRAGQTLGLNERELGALISLPSTVNALQVAIQAEATARKSAFALAERERKAETAAREEAFIAAAKDREVLMAVAKQNARLLNGNGDPSKGLIVRFDRQEQTMSTITKVIYALSVGTILALLKVGIDLLTGG